ncbi:hypothetical protein UFOVP5_35 [uncultured Caudovirales phage]|uniref:Uncharacterized protein n=1 Tax=uncultured Caudovirales phage TaxID=2100421 RepID=A0A6J5KFT3_9CAUD|nr:hypothetical protein UFOVP5_35 [uncultured Caudovirales phage]
MSRTAQWARMLNAANADRTLATEYASKYGALSAKVKAASYALDAGLHDLSAEYLREALASLSDPHSGAPVQDIRGRDAALMRARGMR